MASEQNSPNESGDLTQFLEKFKHPKGTAFHLFSSVKFPKRDKSLPEKSTQYVRSFEKLAHKIQELENKFNASEQQNARILSELSYTRSALEQQKNKDAFLEHLSRSIADLKTSMENLSRAQQEAASRAPSVRQSFDISAHIADAPALVVRGVPVFSAPSDERHQQELQAKERLIATLRKKASQLKAVSSALDREIKKAQREKIEALKKSAGQAREILALRDQLTAAEERLKTFSFDNRVISIRQEYEQRVSHLETQLQEISDSCMRQVEEIELLRTENTKLQQVAQDKEQALMKLSAKEQELQSVRGRLSALQYAHDEQTKQQAQQFAQQVRTLETERDQLANQFQTAQQELETVRSEKNKLEQHFKELLVRMKRNDVVIRKLKQKIAVLNRQGGPVQDRHGIPTWLDIPTNPSAEDLKAAAAISGAEDALVSTPSVKPTAPHSALVAALKTRLVRKKPATVENYSDATATVPLRKPDAPVILPQQFAVIAPMAPTQPTDKPVEITHRAKVTVQSADDLSDVKIARKENSSGEDNSAKFLSKTDSFIGRIKWSVFHDENH